MSLIDEQKTKRHDEELDYVIDWKPDGMPPWLATNELIQCFSVIPEPNLVLGSGDKAPAEAEGKITFWLSGGKPGKVHRVDCRIVTNAGRTGVRTMWIRVIR